MRPSLSARLSLRLLGEKELPSMRLPRSAVKPQANASKAPPSKTKTNTVAAQLEQRARGQQNWNSNMRVEDFVHGKKLYWKVSKPERETLKRLLKES